MSELCQRLQDAKEAGVYQLSCPLEILQESITLAGLRELNLDLQGVTGKGMLLAQLAHVLKAPDWFGHNWDALADALADLSWLEQEGEGYVLVIRNSDETLGLSEQEYGVVTGIFQEAADYWRKQGRPFWVFIV